MDKKIKIVLAAIVITIIGQVIHTIFAQINMSYYMLEEYFPVWSKIMMPTVGPPPASFMIYSLIFALIMYTLFIVVYLIVGKAIPGDNIYKKGAIYGFLVFLIGGLPSMFSLYLLINLPLGLIISWTLAALIINLISGAIVAKMLEK